MYRNISSRYTLCRRNQENQLMVFVPRLESNRWWIYLSIFSAEHVSALSSVLPLQTIQSHDSNSADSRFAIHHPSFHPFLLPPIDPATIHNFLVPLAFFPRRRIGIFLLRLRSSFGPVQEEISPLFGFNVSHR